MAERFPILADAILADDRARVKELLRQDPELARASAPVDRLEVIHWFYAGDTPLHVAAAAHRPETVKLLLAAGVEVDSARNHRRAQPIHYAADGNPASEVFEGDRQVRTLETLLKAGADLHARDKNGATPLHRAVRTRCSRAVRFLLQAGADASLRKKTGSTSFHLAVQNTGRGGSGSEEARAAQREIISAFLEQGIRPTIEDGNGKSVLAWARSGWIRQMLEESHH